MKLRMVIVDCPFRSWQSNEVRRLFMDTVLLKKLGYEAEYASGVLPVGDSDFIALHKIICLDEDGTLTPIIGNHTLTTQRASSFNLVYPALSLVRSAGSIPHVRATEQVISRCHEQARTLGYDGGWAISPEVKHDRRLTIQAHKAFLALKAFVIHHYRIDEVLTAGTVRFNVEKTMKIFGYGPMEFQGQQLSAVPVPRFQNEKVVMLHMKQIAASALDFAREFQAMWDERLILGAENAEQKAAA